MYAQFAARATFGDPTTPVGASYWYVSTKGGFRWAELVLTPAVDARIDDVLRAIADGIDTGRVPVPGRPTNHVDTALPQLRRP